MERIINASDFKARCLAILDEVERTGVPVIILKRGKPVAQLRAAPAEGDARDRLIGSVTFLGNVVDPVLPAETWEADAPNL